MQIKKRDFIADLKTFPGKLKERNAVLYYLGNVMLGVFFLFLIGFALCSYSIYEVCHWLKPGKFALSFALYAYTMGWFLYYLKDTLLSSSIKTLTGLITAIVILAMLTMFIQSWMGSSSYLSLNIDKEQSKAIFNNLALFGDALVILNTCITIYVATQFFRSIALYPKEYLYSIRASLVIFNLSSILGLIMLLRYGPMPFSSDPLNLPFTHFTALRYNLLSMHFLGIHVMQILPLAVYYFPHYLGKKFLIIISSLYSLGSLLLILQLIIHLFENGYN